MCVHTVADTPLFLCSLPWLQLSSLEPATHVYAAWEGFPTEAMEAVGRLFARSPSVRAITVVQRSMRKQVRTKWKGSLLQGMPPWCAACLPGHTLSHVASLLCCNPVLEQEQLTCVFVFRFLLLVPPRTLRR